MGTKPVDQNISDLFFNTDVSDAVVNDNNGNFASYDIAKLRNEAEMFLNCLYRLGVSIPSVDDLLADFDRRT